MPKATAVWLIDNTSLTFAQIAEFCGLHLLEIQALADGDVESSVIGLDPITRGQLELEEINLCEKDPKRSLILKKPLDTAPAKGKKSKYTPLAKRQDRPDAIAWIIKNYPLLADIQICHLLGTTRPTVNAVRTKTHWNTQNIKPRNPVSLGLCSQGELDDALKTINETSKTAFAH